MVEESNVFTLFRDILTLKKLVIFRFDGLVLRPSRLLQLVLQGWGKCDQFQIECCVIHFDGLGLLF